MYAIAQLDLDPIKAKLMHKESGEGWTVERANAVELEYRRFLTLMKKFPHEATSPLVDVDTFWHYHILDTMKYAADCEAVFGYFLHHFPYIGMRGEEDAAILAQIGQRMQTLYEQEFGVPYGRGALAANAAEGAAGAAHGGWTPGQYAGRSAYCGSTTTVAYCGSTTMTAYCGSTHTVAYCGMTTGAGNIAAMPGLYTERPRLS